MSFEAIVELRNKLDATLQRIRSERQIRSPLLQCPLCGHVGEAAEPHVSVRAMILSPNRFGIAPAEQAYAAYKNAPGGSVYVEYDIPAGLTKPAGSGWARIPGPNSVEGRAATTAGQLVPQMPPVKNITVVKTK